MRRALRNMGGYLVMTVAVEFVEQNGLAEGADVVLHLHSSWCKRLAARSAIA